MPVQAPSRADGDAAQSHHDCPPAPGFRSVWLIADGFFAAAFWLFVPSGISDGIDGYIARRFDMQSELAPISIRLPTRR
ncbi:MAG: CDP-alcohol phosphatidyltransferase family protein [Alphaproteobacteria bacterium]|nr:CDP-alcohol phosphatidyltransferase family protein [Alphaproteobacteria bacterium]